MKVNFALSIEISWIPFKVCANQNTTKPSYHQHLNHVKHPSLGSSVRKFYIWMKHFVCFVLCLICLMLSAYVFTTYKYLILVMFFHQKVTHVTLFCITTLLLHFLNLNVLLKFKFLKSINAIYFKNIFTRGIYWNW